MNTEHKTLLDAILIQPSTAQRQGVFVSTHEDNQNIAQCSGHCQSGSCIGF